MSHTYPIMASGMIETNCFSISNTSFKNGTCNSNYGDIYFLILQPMVSWQALSFRTIRNEKLS